MCIPIAVTTNDWDLSNSGCPTDDMVMMMTKN